MMQASGIDFARSARGMRISGWPLLAVAIVAATAVSSWWADARHESAALDALERSTALEAATPREDPEAEREMRAANEAIEQIALPWDRLFGAVEGAALEGVNLLGISPDARTGSVQLRAETTGTEVMFEYARRLAQQPGLSGVYLVEHRIEEKKSSHPLQFVLTASWLEPAP